MTYRKFAAYYRRNIGKDNRRHYALGFALYAVVALSFIANYFIPGLIFLLFPFVIIPFVFTIHLANVRVMVDVDFQRGLYRNFASGFQEKIFRTYQPFYTLIKGFLIFIIFILIGSLLVSAFSFLFPTLTAFANELESYVSAGSYTAAETYINENWSVIAPFVTAVYLLATEAMVVYVSGKSLLNGLFINYAIGLTVTSSLQARTELADPYAVFKSNHRRIMLIEELLPLLLQLVVFVVAAYITYLRYPNDPRLVMTVGMIFGLLPPAFYLYRLFNVSDVLYDLFFRAHADYFLNVIKRDGEMIIARPNLDPEIKKRIAIYLATLEAQIAMMKASENTQDKSTSADKK